MLILLGWAPIALIGVSQTAVLAIAFLFGIGSQFAGEPLYKVWSQELVPTLLRSTSQGLTMAVARVVAALLAIIAPTLLLTHPRPLFVAVFVLAAVAVAIGQFWVPRLPRARDLEAPPLVVTDAPAEPMPDAQRS
ncbi:hypothetical protein [Nonomuraea sp. NEAU-A123]|uniref:hypothetical protein n=1 Tax=Nonomuraea sp. NEAU-A123 TaxID=2839649 RepID=UPI001BE45393|nr:hypothetical protein [Nonomuraea sp. NEAU-A123]MBT2226888.1 hypothetical protein [Nonomuraea sp. NEAU-A123]